jgi:rRNA maturation endonuclease Nob1
MAKMLAYILLINISKITRKGKGNENQKHRERNHGCLYKYFLRDSENCGIR